MFLQINRFINWLETGVKIATLVNFLVFLQSGWYLSLVERILGIRSVFPEKQGIRQVSPVFFSNRRSHLVVTKQEISVKK